MTSTLSTPIVTAPNGVSVNISHGTLMSALDIFRSVSPLRPAVPIMGSVKVTADAGRISASVYDYDTSVSVDMGETDSVDGCIVVPFRTLDERAKALVKGTTKTRAASVAVTLTETSAAVPAVPGVIDPESRWGALIGAVPAKDGQSSLVADGYTYTIPTMSVDEFPALPVNTELSAYAEVDRDALVTAVARVKVSAGKDDTLPMLTGILFTNETTSDGIDLVATDRFRLNVAPIKAAAEGTVKVLVPAAAIAKLVKHLPAGPVGLEFDGAVMYLTAGSVKVTVRLLDNEFVKYARLIPTEMSTTVLVNRKALVTAVERVAVVVDKHHHVRLTVSPTGIVVSAGDTEEGTATSPVISGDVDGTERAYASDPILLIACNPGYLLDALKGDTTELVAVGFNGPNKPILFADSVDALTDPASFRQLVMPARIPA